MRKVRWLVAAMLLLWAPGAWAAGQLDIGLAGDPGLLDPALSGNYLDRNVFAALCDKLLDTDAEQRYVPQLATSWEWSADNLALTLHLRAGVHFQDGTPFDADAVRVNIARDKALPRSVRKGELALVTSVEVVDPLTARLHLSAPFAPLLAALADRSGVIESPAALKKWGDDIALHPTCAGPYSLTERISQDHITVDRFPGYWNAAAIAIDRIVYHPMTDSTVRLVNLQSGRLQIADQLAPNDVPTVKADARLAVAQHVASAFRLLQFNLAHGPRANTALAHDPRIREALDKTLDRNVLNQVVFNGLFVPGTQTQAESNRYWDPDYPVHDPDLAGAHALLKQAGVDHVAFTLQLGPGPIDGQIGQVIQAMAAQAGFDIKLQQVEGNAGNDMDLAGDFDVALLTWSGRADPDANLSNFLACNGAFNTGHYCSPAMDGLLAQGRSTLDADQRVPIYRRVVAQAAADLPQLILYHYTWLWGLSARVGGFVPNQDGLIRPQGLTLKP